MKCTLECAEKSYKVSHPVRLVCGEIHSNRFDYAKWTSGKSRRRNNRQKKEFPKHVTCAPFLDRYLGIIR
jgi:hypothetical protein